MIRACALPVLLAAALALPAQAQGGGPQAELEAGIVNAEDLARLTLKGKTEGLPDGTRVHVTLWVRGLEVEASFFMVEVRGNAFAANKVFRNKRFAPLPYELKIELLLSAQRKAIGEFVRRNWGLPQRAKVLMAQKSLEIGTLEEQNEFRTSSVKELLSLTEKAQATNAILLKVFNAPLTKDKMERNKQSMSLAQDLQAGFTQPFDSFLNQYVALHEPSAISNLTKSMSLMGRCLSYLRKGKAPKGKATSLRVRDMLQIVHDELASRLPKPPGQGEEAGDPKPETPKKD
ncbi:MAG TPA: hypothetical protein DEA08_08535 [Planctomycetes bacterium]|nr:hypothetical protein [Planctomycetota bacterium]